MVKKKNSPVEAIMPVFRAAVTPLFTLCRRKVKNVGALIFSYNFFNNFHTFVLCTIIYQNTLNTEIFGFLFNNRLQTVTNILLCLIYWHNNGNSLKIQLISNTFYFANLLIIFELSTNLELKNDIITTNH